jgi:hypothetical protein
MEYQSCKENRYRFAWIVATVAPAVLGEDLDPSLILLARRALDKDWKRRSSLCLEDFIDMKASRTKLGLELIGFTPNFDKDVVYQESKSIRQSLIDLARGLENQIVNYQRSRNILATHKTVDGRIDHEQVVELGWQNRQTNSYPSFKSFQLLFTISIVETQNLQISVKACLRALRESAIDQIVDIEIPPITYSDEAGALLYSNCVGAIAELASMLVNAS